jgi:hypothetical protein
VFEEDVYTRILEDEVLYRVAYVRYIKYLVLVRTRVRGGGLVLIALVQPLSRPVTEGVRLSDLAKARDLAAFLHPVLYQV